MATRPIHHVFGLSLAVGGLIGALVAIGPTGTGDARSSAIVPQPTTTTTVTPTWPTRPTPPSTTSTTVVVSVPPTPLPVPQPTDPPVITDPPTTIAPPPSDPPVLTVPPTPAPGPQPTDSPQQVPAPVAAPQWIAAPVVMDPHDPTPMGPVIVWALPTCAGADPPDGAVTGHVVNPDLYHYPKPFTAPITVELFHGADVVESQMFDLIASNINGVTVVFESLEAGTYTMIAKNETDPGALQFAIPVEVVDCADVPTASDPLPPVPVVGPIKCATDNQWSATGAFTYGVINPTGDDGSPRTYTSTLTKGQSNLPSVGDEVVADGAYAELDDHMYGFSGMYQLTVTDTADASLSATVTIDVPECAPPTPGAGTPQTPSILDVDVECANEPSADGSARLVLFNPNFDVLDTSAPAEFELDVSGVGAETWILEPGVAQYVWVHDLAVGAYQATLSMPPWPISDTVTFHVHPCSALPADDESELTVQPWTVCPPESWMEAVLFTLWYDGDDTKQLLWSIGDGDGADFDSGTLATSNSGGVFGGEQLPPGGYYLTVTDQDDDSLLYSHLVIVGQCADPPPDVTEPTDPTDPSDPADPTDPGHPTDPTDPGTAPDPTPPPDATELADATTPTGTLPATR